MSCHTSGNCKRFYHKIPKHYVISLCIELSCYWSVKLWDNIFVKVTLYIRTQICLWWCSSYSLFFFYLIEELFEQVMNTFHKLCWNHCIYWCYWFVFRYWHNTLLLIWKGHPCTVTLHKCLWHKELWPEATLKYNCHCMCSGCILLLNSLAVYKLGFPVSKNR